ncbi:MAG: glycosyltransferase family 1 protein [Hyphomicrobiales bacterium]|nr:glycosyltransferase family 1 protein [Hyphomicrobiales bacterium]
MDPSQARLLEIGHQAFLKEAYPERTTLLWTGRARPAYWADRSPPVHIERRDYVDCTPAAFVRAMRDVRRRRYDLVVVYLPLYSPWRDSVRALLKNPLTPWGAFTRPFGLSWLRLIRLPVPLIALDFNDAFLVRRPSLALIKRADVVFKRELPADRWQLLVGSAHRALPTLRIRSSKKWQETMEKIRPIVLPARPVDNVALWGGGFPEKTADIFFSGSTEANSWVRRTGIKALRALAERGITVDIPDRALPTQEFYRRMSKAWLAWSPAGFGWDCFRTPEAALCLSVPVVNHPPLERYRPLLHGQHLIQYDVEDGGLERVVLGALSDKARLRAMAIAAREHVLEHFTLPALARHIVETGLSAGRSRR